LSGEQVVSAGAVDGVAAAGLPDQDVVMGAADDPLDAVILVAARFSAAPRAGPARETEIDLDAGGGVREGDEVGARAAIDGVAAGAALERVVPIAAEKRVVAGKALEDVVGAGSGERIALPAVPGTTALLTTGAPRAPPCPDGMRLVRNAMVAPSARVRANAGT
jgi:hypothetical protein